MNIDYVNFVPNGGTIPRTLFKFREATIRSLDSLLHNQVYFANPKQFNDPYEPIKIFEDKGRFGNILTQTVELSGIFCLCPDPSNLAMWAYYADALKGFAVGYDTQEFLSSIGTEIWKHVLEIQYVNDGISEVKTKPLISGDPHAINAERFKMYGIKAKDFAHENEIRIIIEPDVNFTRNGYGLYKHSPNSINEVIFGEFISKEDEDKIREITKDRKIIYKRAVRRPNQYKIDVLA